MVEARYLGLTANQLAKIATDLKAENAKLLNRNQELEANNAKLREQVQRYLTEIEQLTTAIYQLNPQTKIDG